MDTKLGHRSFFRITGLILLIISLAAVIWIIYDFHFREARTILGSVDLNVGMISKLHSVQETNRNKIEALQASYNDSSNWKIRESAKMVLEADIQLRAEKNAEKALYFLNSAKTLLSKADPVKAEPLITALNPIIEKLKQIQAVPLVEINQILIKNQRLLSNLIFTAMPNLLPDEVLEAPVSEKGWRLWVQAFLNKFKNFIVVRKTEAPLLPLISKDMQLLAEQHLSSLLTQIQWAAMHGQNTIYQDDLNQVLWLVQHYYDLKNVETQCFLSDISHLQKINVEPVFPDLGPVFAIYVPLKLN